jgi:hypothetical protein
LLIPSDSADLWCDYPSPAQIAESTVTFSPSPLSKWAVLANLDLIRQRNKIKTENEPIRIPFILSNTVARPDVCTGDGMESGVYIYLVLIY